MKKKSETKKISLLITFIFFMTVILLIPFSRVQAQRYVDNGNDTLTDTMTGLIWQKANDGSTRTLPASRTYCENLILGESQNWRMPRIDELSTIIDYSRPTAPTLDAQFIHNGSVYGYWPDTQTQYSTGLFWTIQVLNGGVGWTYDSNPMLVRCVQGGGLSGRSTPRIVWKYTEKKP